MLSNRDHAVFFGRGGRPEKKLHEIGFHFFYFVQRIRKNPTLDTRILSSLGVRKCNIWSLTNKQSFRRYFRFVKQRMLKAKFWIRVKIKKNKNLINTIDFLYKKSEEQYYKWAFLGEKTTVSDACKKPKKESRNLVYFENKYLSWIESSEQKGSTERGPY